LLGLSDIIIGGCGEGTTTLGSSTGNGGLFTLFGFGFGTCTTLLLGLLVTTTPLFGSCGGGGTGGTGGTGDWRLFTFGSGVE